MRRKKRLIKQEKGTHCLVKRNFELVTAVGKYIKRKDKLKKNEEDLICQQIQEGYILKMCPHSQYLNRQIVSVFIDKLMVYNIPTINIGLIGLEQNNPVNLPD